ncbi:hypothetical protein F443_07955 [Plasmopara halstedii]|uniref:S-adenosyl-L-methionine-dependent methyltransferase n=1 Tax=Plasmopara halstedii TaxID=4781 RepID=A0A0P1B1H9_PLAHL|nr:hypothetical protein F443_07955 [Plasmopara halstedii]CEG48537.1 hypothetical protein F443_07955 [Plasmopara halstedii]|eukprot:XP_024584906.1 hypothetical protein F443_07955 [Plasmopara halstedii]
MDPASSSSLLQVDCLEVDDAFAESMSFVTTYLRARESDRNDRIINDPFAKPLTRKQKPKIEKFLEEMTVIFSSFPPDFIALRTRYLDEALCHRDPKILQIVILGAGLDARAYRLASLRGCHVLEVDRSSSVFEHKAEVIKELHAPLVAQNVDSIVSDLAQAGLETNLMGHGFNPTMPTFWVMEGLIPYMERSSIADLMKAIEYLSAPGSAFWADIPGQIMVDGEEWGKHAMKYGEDEPLQGLLSELSWTLNVQASLTTAGEHFGRQWTPVISPKSEEVVPYFFVLGKKPISDAVVEQKVIDGLDFDI